MQKEVHQTEFFWGGSNQFRNQRMLRTGRYCEDQTKYGKKEGSQESAGVSFHQKKDLTIIVENEPKTINPSHFLNADEHWERPEKAVDGTK